MKNGQIEENRADCRMGMACSEYEMTVSTLPKDIEKQRLDDRLDEALAESFPASDRSAVHSLDAGRSGTTAIPSSIGQAARENPIEFEQGSICMDAALVAEGFGMTPALVLARIREGHITSRCERGMGDDAGRWRTTFFHDDRSIGFVVDVAGKVLARSSRNHDGRPGIAIAARSESGNRNKTP